MPHVEPRVPSTAEATAAVGWVEAGTAQPNKVRGCGQGPHPAAGEPLTTVTRGVDMMEALHAV